MCSGSGTNFNCKVGMRRLHVLLLLYLQQDYKADIILLLFLIEWKIGA